MHLFSRLNSKKRDIRTGQCTSDSNGIPAIVDLNIVSKRTMFSRYRRLAMPSYKRRGAVLAEMAIITPILIFLLLGVLEASRMCMISQLLTNAAREGCRTAVTNGMQTNDVLTRIETTLDATELGLYQKVTTQLSPGSISTTSLNTPITVTISVPFRSVDWLSTPFLFGSSTISATAVMLSQRP